MVSAGRMPYRLTLQRAAETTDAHGQKIKSWSDVATVWAGFVWLAGIEREEANQSASDTTIRAFVRCSSIVKAVTENDRIVWRGGPLKDRIFELSGMPEINMIGDVVHLRCRELV